MVLAKWGAEDGSWVIDQAVVVVWYFFYRQWVGFDQQLWLFHHLSHLFSLRGFFKDYWLINWNYSVTFSFIPSPFHFFEPCCQVLHELLLPLD